MAVAYGANGKYFYRTLTNSTSCNNSIFGDPNVGTVKACYLMGPPPNTTSWILCINSPCSFDNTQEVAYGANGLFFYRALTNGTACDNTTFGGDPAPGFGKACYYQ